MCRVMSENKEKNNKKNNPTSWIICILLIVCILFVSVISFAIRKGAGVIDRASDSDATDTDADEGATVSDAKSKYITVKWQGKEYTGMYSGTYKKDKPSGEGTFVSDDEKLTYHGDWKKGKFNGFGKITYIDGSYETGSYEKGKRHGKIKQYKDENNYSVARYNEDVLYGERIYYENDEEVDTKWYYKGKTLAKIEKKAIELTTQVFENREYIDKTVYIEGTVAFVGETSKTEYFRIDTASIGMVIGKYSNQLGKYAKQANLPTMRVGDKVRIYGTYSDMSRYQCINDAEAFDHDYPEIKPMFGYIIEEGPEVLTKPEEADDKKESDGNINNDDIKNLSDEYKAYLRFPFEHYTRWTSEKYVVKEVLRSGKKIYINAYIQGKSSDEEYVLFFNAEGDEFIRKGDVLKVSGYFDGQYKVLKDEEKELYEKQQKKKYYLNDRYSGVKVDLNQAVFTYTYDAYPAIHVYKWKKK